MMKISLFLLTAPKPIPRKTAAAPSSLSLLTVKPSTPSSFPVTILTPRSCICLTSKSTASKGKRKLGISVLLSPPVKVSRS